MNDIPIKKLMGIILIASFLTVSTSYAKTTQDNIDDAKNQIQDIQDQKKDAENRVDDINGKKEGLETNLGSLNGQLTQIVSSMNELETQISDKEAEIEQAQSDLEAAEEQSRQQYEDMKCRIQFMYENGSKTAWQMLLEATSFTEFLNRTEYVTEMTNYDRKKLVEFQELQQQIRDQKTALEGEMTELVALQDDMKKKQNSVNSLIDTTKANIAGQIRTSPMQRQT